MSIRAGDKLRLPIDLSSKTIYNSPEKANPKDLSDQIPSCMPQGKSSPIQSQSNKLNTRAQQNENLAWQIQDASRNGDGNLLAKVLKGLSKGTRKVIVNKSDENGDTPLFLCTESKSFRCLKLLLKAGANPLRRNAEKQNFLHIAACCGCSELIGEFLKSVPSKITKALIHSSDRDGYTPLLWCAQSKSVKGTQLLLKAGANPSHRNAEKENFLHIAADSGRSALIEIFLKSIPKDVAKTLMNSSDKDGDAPLLNCAFLKSVKEMQLLLKAGANPSYRNAKRGNFLHVSACFGGFALIEMFLKSVPKNLTKGLINSSDRDGYTPLLWCARSKSVKVVRLLLKAGANPLHRSASRESFLHIAAYYGRSSLIKMFIKSVPQDVTKALINSSDKNGYTPLLCYASSKSGNTKECAQLLLKAKANPLIFSQSGNSPYLEALEKGHASMVRLLAKKDPKQKGIFALFNLGVAFGRELNPELLGKKVGFPGSKSKFWSGNILSTLQSTQEPYGELRQAFALSSAKNPPVEEIVQKIRQGKLVIVPTGWKEHAVSLVFRDGYLVVCNRGEGSTDENFEDQTFFIRKISSNLMTKELLKRCLVKKDASAVEGIEFFYKELPQALNGTEDDFCQRVLAIAPKQAKADTCAYTCMKAALRASLALITKDPKAARDMAKAWATKHRESALEMFRETPSPFDKAFRKKTIDAMSKRLKKRKQDSARILAS